MLESADFEGTEKPIMHTAVLWLSSIRRTLLPLLGLDDWHKALNEAGRPTWRRYAAKRDTWEFRPMTPEEENNAFWWCYQPPY